MILLIDFRADRLSFTALRDNGEELLHGRPELGWAAIFAKAQKKFGLSRHAPEAVVMTTGAGGSWSNVRQAAAVANTLAFAWNVPIAPLSVDAGEDDESVANRARQAARKATRSAWARALYDGEPNITTPKPLR